MLKAWICILLIGAATMALPAVSFAQSAGDDQYQDPLSGGGGGSGASGSGNSGGGSTSPGSSGSAGESAQSAQSGRVDPVRSVGPASAHRPSRRRARALRRRAARRGRRAEAPGLAAPRAVAAQVVIDARAAARREIGGVERVAHAMVRELPRVSPGRYRVAQPPRALAHRAGHAWEQAVLPLAARDAELIYCPAQLAPVASRRAVVVMHDAAPLRHPEWYSRAYVAWQRAVLPRIARRARALVSVSAFSKAELVEALGVDPGRITVIPNGVDERFTPQADPAPARAAHGLDGPYALAVGTRIARKNLGALEAASRALESAGIELVAAGSGRGYMREEGAPPARALGYVAEEHLPGLYAGASVLVMPSVYEGFGLPCIEAMASGTPVVAADRGALPETCGGAALLVDPGDETALAEAVLTAATEDATRTRLVAAGRDRAAALTWRSAAEQTDELITRLLAAA